MKMRLWLAIVVVFVLHVGYDVNVEASPGRKNKNKDGSIFDSNKNKNNLFSNKNTDFGSGTYKKKGGAMKTLKKAAVIGEDKLLLHPKLNRKCQIVSRLQIDIQSKIGILTNSISSYVLCIFYERA